MSLRAHLHTLTNCQQIETLWDAHTRKMADYGFDRLMYGFTRYRTPNSLGDPEDFIILANHPPAYTDVFIGEKMYLHALMVHWVLNNEGAGSWSKLAEMLRNRTLTPAEARVVNFNKKMDVTAGYSVSFKTVSARSKGAIALTARAGMSQAEVDAVWGEHGEDILLMNNVLHLKILTLPYVPPGRVLTQRQREALEWVGDGKTTQDIALLLGLTAATVEKHLRLARDALAVETTAQAVLKASFANQMFILDA